MKERLRGVMSDAGLSHRLNPKFRTLQTRLILSLAGLLAAKIYSRLRRSCMDFLIIVVYFVLILVITIPPFVGRRKRFRVLRDVLDLIAISFLVHFTGGVRSPWHPLYIFPVMSAARYLGPVGTIAMAAVFNAGLWCDKALSLEGTPRLVTLFGFGRQLQLGIAWTAANLARTRDYTEEEVVRAIEQIDLEMLITSDLGKVIRSILRTAIEIADSDACAILLLEDNATVAAFALTRTGPTLRISTRLASPRPFPLSNDTIGEFGSLHRRQR